MTLAELTNGQEAIIIKVRGHGAFRRRIIEMGFVKGKKVLVIKNAPLKDPIEYQILNYKISLRRSEAELIEVVTVEEAIHFAEQEYHGTSITDEDLAKVVSEKRKTINIALVGNPNCGKTTLFNQASGSYEHVGNYGGVTVDVKSTTFEHKGYTLHLSDLPGTYSLSAYSPEEVYVREHISQQTPDIVINVLDASNLERNLYLTTQLIHMDVKVVIALNMFDDFQKRGDNLDYKHLGKMLGMPIVPTVSSKGKGINKLFDKAINVYEDKVREARPVKINFGNQLEKSIQKVEDLIKLDQELATKFPPRFLAIKLLEKDKGYNKYIKKKNYHEILKEVESQQEKIEDCRNEDIETTFTDARYGFIAGALKETFKENPIQRRRRTDAIDNFLTHKLIGFPLFFLFMWIMFQATFTLGQYPMAWIETGVALLSDWLGQIMNEGSFKDLLIDGVVGGVGGVIVFLPNILILFFFISFMEDTGYMARAAFIMDKVMHKIGLHGKSFIPLIMGFGCNVPAIMATRTIEDRNSRLLTILINPFMSCSARLPVYILFIAAFFPQYPGTILFALYATGILLAVIVARLFKRFIFTKSDVPFVMELPPYRLPTLKSTTRHMWHKGQQYLQKMGGIILIASIIIWFLGYFPRESSKTQEIQTQIEQISQQYDSSIRDASSTNQKQELTAEKEARIKTLEEKEHVIQQEESYIGRLGHAVEPVIKPLGFDWKMGVSLISGIAAKEIVISTMSVLYQSAHQQDENSTALVENLRADTDKEGNLVFTPLIALSFLMFILIYFPCIAVIAAIKKESGAWKWAIFTIVYTTALAWLVSFGVYQIGRLFF
ncbi:ferrous iron transport protein B [Geofilum rubicundum]|uniref:Ferrous iron transport protein B n=1 Tax=Geofilum rubicundum JCM 15548 TaxID=1236989 RepID=A0A0E9LUJ8_9BACT|nr:ferrous iron transport protein B [Geofilum rubicundum]GAO28958.1 ferrous iron transport protein B [Geofilum rubicundum JCM 15548]